MPAKKSLDTKDIMVSLAITVFGCVLPVSMSMYCWSVTKFPPQIFGSNEDHFRGHVIDPIPGSVEILDVVFDDLIILPDVSYYFRFTVNKTDLRKIIDHHSLQPFDKDCSVPNPPEWWVDTTDNLEVYEFEKLGGTVITLCYHTPDQTAYYLFLTY